MRANVFINFDANINQSIQDIHQTEVKCNSLFHKSTQNHLIGEAPLDKKFQYRIMRKTIIDDKLQRKSLYLKLKYLTQDNLNKFNSMIGKTSK